MDFGAGAEPGDEYYRSLGEKTDMSAFGKWSGQVSDLRWHGEIQARQVLYQTSGRDNDYSEIDIQDELTFFNPKAGLTWTPSDDLAGFCVCSRGAP